MITLKRLFRHLWISAGICLSLPSFAQSPSWPTLTFTPVANGLNQPTHITDAKDGSGRLFITEQVGRIRVVQQRVLVKTPFLDISSRVSCCGERGLLSVAFPPNYVAKRHFYVSYTNLLGDSVISRFKLNPKNNSANPASEEILLTIKQPFANHNGGLMAFGPDSLLYIGMGDGGSAGDPFKNGQNPASLLGKLLRLDVEANVSPYKIPPSNPFVNQPAWRGEIWAYGLRNPWRFSFDRQTGDLYIADVGQNNYEEVHVQSAASPGGENYGWNIMEGTHCYASATCNTTGLTLPVVEYDHQLGCSITGGFVYRGNETPTLQGIYLYGDACSGRIWGLQRTASGWENKQLTQTSYFISTFGEDEVGRLYVADYQKGVIYHIGGAAPVAASRNKQP